MLLRAIDFSKKKKKQKTTPGVVPLSKLKKKQKRRNVNSKWKVILVVHVRTQPFFCKLTPAHKSKPKLPSRRRVSSRKIRGTNKSPRSK